jgi:hypothetical protein
MIFCSFVAVVSEKNILLKLLNTCKLHFLINTGMRSGKQILNPFFHGRGTDLMAGADSTHSPPPTPEIKNKG